MVDIRRPPHSHKLPKAFVSVHSSPHTLVLPGLVYAFSNVRNRESNRPDGRSSLVRLRYGCVGG